MNALIVDDEQPARDELRWLIDQCDGIEVTAEASSAEEARDEIAHSDELDLAFLDIDMPGVDGMRLAESFESRAAPLVVFVTAYDEFAVDAFEIEAVDYLLKPVRLDRLQKAITRARRRLDRSGGISDAENSDGSDREGDDDRILSRVSVQHDDEYLVLETTEILYFEAMQGEVWAETPEARYATDFSLKFLERRLDDDRFFRSHRSYIIRLDAVERIIPAGAGTYRLQLTDRPDDSDEATVPLARGRVDELKQQMPWSDA